jgi:hypothetical protein
MAAAAFSLMNALMQDNDFLPGFIAFRMIMPGRR